MEELVGAEEKKVLQFIARRERRGDPSPGAREIGCAVGIQSSREVHALLRRLAGDGYLLRDAGWHRMLQLTDHGWRLAGDMVSTGRMESRTEAGVLPASLDGVDSVDGARRHMLRVEAGSLVRAGMSGDELLVVEEIPEPGDGDLIVALVGEGLVLKRLRRGGEDAYLLPVGEGVVDPNDGPACEPPLPISAAEIKGRVVYAVRPL